MHDDFDENNSVKFTLNIKCSRKPAYKNYKYEQLVELDPEKYLDYCNVYASDLIWEPLANQAEKFKEPPRVLHDKIIIAKLRENQELEIDLFCAKGVGKTHAKWSPVSTAYYKLKPHISFNGPVEGEDVLE